MRDHFYSTIYDEKEKSTPGYSVNTNSQGEQSTKIPDEAFKPPIIEGDDYRALTDKCKFYITAKKTISERGYDKSVDSYILLKPSGRRVQLTKNQFNAMLKEDMNKFRETKRKKGISDEDPSNKPTLSD